MFYPRNFPKELEQPLIGLLLLLEKDFKKQVPVHEKRFSRLILDHLKNSPNKIMFKGKKPSLWWLNFIILRHEQKFTPLFRSQIAPFLTKTKTRSLSGIVPLSLFTKGTGCPFNCVYCPNEPGVPKSYFSDEPAVMRAIRHGFDPYKQTLQRLIMFALSNHPIDKVEVIIKGGTFSFYHRQYRCWFVKRVFDAANSDILAYIKTGKLHKTPSRTLKQAQEINETASSRIIGINIETRPDFINNQEILFLRKLGVTHVEIGVQALDNEIYRLIRRGHTVKDVRQATRLLKEAGFKVGYHLMPNLPSSSPRRDFALLEKAFAQDDFKPDHLKLYPTTVTKHTILSEWLKKGQYVPYPMEELVNILVKFKSEIAPPWVRIGRLTRDITTTVMEGEGIVPNLREVLQKKMETQQLVCNCIRCREIKDKKITGLTRLRIIEYRASEGREYFLEYVDETLRSLGFLRLRLSGQAIVRELHVYGRAVPIGKKEDEKVQHKSIGKQLLETAEALSAKMGFGKIAVIAGVGTREYYRKRGYELEDTYMVKALV